MQNPSRGPAAEAGGDHEQVHPAARIAPADRVAQAAQAQAQLGAHLRAVHHEARRLPGLVLAVEPRERNLHVGRAFAGAGKPECQQARRAVGRHSHQAAGVRGRRVRWHRDHTAVHSLHSAQRAGEGGRRPDCLHGRRRSAPARPDQGCTGGQGEKQGAHDRVQHGQGLRLRPASVAGPGGTGRESVDNAGCAARWPTPGILAHGRCQAPAPFHPVSQAA